MWLGVEMGFRGKRRGRVREIEGLIGESGVVGGFGW